MHGGHDLFVRVILESQNGHLLIAIISW